METDNRNYTGRDCPANTALRKVSFRVRGQSKIEPAAITNYGDHHCVPHSMIDLKDANVEKFEGAKNAAILYRT